jgi:hypothetical protein
MQRVRLIEPDGTEHLVPCVRGAACRFCAALRRAHQLSSAAFVYRSEATPEEKILRLAQAVYEAETAPAEAAHAAPAAGAAEPGAAAEASEAAFASAVDFVLKARAELEVRAPRLCAARGKSAHACVRNPACLFCSPYWTS